MSVGETIAALALLFTVAGLIGLLVTLLAMRSGAYRRLSAMYLRPEGREDVPLRSGAPAVAAGHDPIEAGR